MSGKYTRGPEFHLTPLTSKVKRKPFVVFDIESKHNETQMAGFTRPFLVGFYDGLHYQSFRNAPVCAAENQDWHRRYDSKGGCIDRFMRMLLTKKYAGHHIYAHNGGNFDFLFLLRWLLEHGDEFSITKLIPVQSSIQMIEVRLVNAHKKKPIKWTFLDSMKLLPMGLDRAAKTFGFAGKREMDLDLDESDPQWNEYLEKDCTELYQVMQATHDLIEDKLGGEVGMTTPATSMKLFRRRFMGKGECPDKIPCHAHLPDCKCPDDPVTGHKAGACGHAFIRKAYYGGRTEIHRMKGENLHYYDINSSYVAAMLDGMPAGDCYAPYGEIDWRLRGHFVGFAEVTVHIPPECEVPPLPYRDVSKPSAPKLLFPTGTFSGTWDIDELALLDHPRVKGKILETRQVVWYKKKKVFGEMVGELYKLRDKSLPTYDEGLSLLAKLLGNALYGKFGMNEERQSILVRKGGPCGPGECYLCREQTGNPDKYLCGTCDGAEPVDDDGELGVYYVKSQFTASYIIPQIAAHITSLARIRLFHINMKVLDAGGKLYYNDTDSVLTDVELATGPGLGELKDEYPGELLKGEFVQPKVYLLEKKKPFEGEHHWACLDRKTCKGCSRSKVRMKGFGRSAQTKKNLRKLQRGESVAFERLAKVRTLARLGFREGPFMVDVVKSFQTTYEKRQVLPDGSTKARVIDETLEEMAAE